MSDFPEEITEVELNLGPVIVGREEAAYKTSEPQC